MVRVALASAGDSYRLDSFGRSACDDQETDRESSIDDADVAYDDGIGFGAHSIGLGLPLRLGDDVRCFPLLFGKNKQCGKCLVSHAFELRQYIRRDIWLAVAWVRPPSSGSRWSPASLLSAPVAQGLVNRFNHGPGCSWRS